MIYSKENIFNKKCYSCKKNDHFITSCPLLTLNINKEKVIKNHIANSDYQQRENYHRKAEKIKTKKNYLKLLKANEKFIQDQESLCNSN